ncbi:hypothetical protein GpartN1_g7711.t1 [Galdieria partita]|uniref:Uncharacterized protein n=1 Tax=Galdieria partita TaxID=83374 RepID=A0A9C7Q4S2_9RHOD|nr:hypothetical protein GpartN1_g7711.t1 [Galdieria partita]
MLSVGFSCATCCTQSWNTRVLSSRNKCVYFSKGSFLIAPRRACPCWETKRLALMVADGARIAPDRNESLLGIFYFSKPDELPRLVQEHLDELDEDFYAFLQFKIDSASDVEERNALKILKDALTDIIQSLGKEALEQLVSQGPSASDSNVDKLNSTGTSYDAASYDSLIDSLLNREDTKTGVEAEYDKLDGYFLERLEWRIRQASGDTFDKLVLLDNTIQEVVQDRMKLAGKRLSDALQCGSPEIIERKFEEMNRRGEIDSALLLLLSANIEEARKQNSMQAVKVLERLQNKVAQLKDQSTSPEVALVRQLLRTENEEARREIVKKAFSVGPSIYLADGSVAPSKPKVNGKKFIQVLKKLKEDFGNVDFIFSQKLDTIAEESERVVSEILEMAQLDKDAMQEDAFYRQRVSVWELAEWEERYEQQGKQAPWQKWFT